MVDKAKRVGLFIALAWGCLLGGCYSPNPEDIQAWVRPHEVDVTAEDYVVQPPDELEIHCVQVPEVHLQRQRIRPDGKISFEALGEIDVAGKTPGEIAQVLEQRVKELYTLPGDHAVDVRITIFASKVYYVLGQVFRPGPRTYTGRDSLLMSLATAGPNPIAWEQRVQVIRPSNLEDSAPRIFEVNYEDMIVRGDISLDVLLEEGDIVYVPPTILGQIGLVLEELITPVARAFYGWYLVNNPPTTSDRGYFPTAGVR